MTLKVTAPIVAAFTASVKGASDLNETVSKTGEVFKEQSDMVMDLSLIHIYPELYKQLTE